MRNAQSRKQSALPPDAYKPYSKPTSVPGLPYKIVQVEKAAAITHELEEIPVSIKPTQVKPQQVEHCKNTQHLSYFSLHRLFTSEQTVSKNSTIISRHIL